MSIVPSYPGRINLRAFRCCYKFLTQTRKQHVSILTHTLSETYSVVHGILFFNYLQGAFTEEHIRNGLLLGARLSQLETAAHVTFVMEGIMEPHKLMNYKAQQQMYQKGDHHIAIYPRNGVFANEENFINGITIAMVKKASYRKRNYPSIDRFKKECQLYMVRIHDVNPSPKHDDRYEETKEEMECVDEETKAGRDLFRAALRDKGGFDLHFPLDTQDKVMIAIFVATLTSPGRILPCTTVVALVMAIRATKKLSGMEDVTEESVRGTLMMMNKCGVLELQQQDDHETDTVTTTTTITDTTTTTATTTDTTTTTVAVAGETKVALCGEMENYDVLRRRVDAFLTQHIVTTATATATTVASPVVSSDSPINATASTSDNDTAGSGASDSTSASGSGSTGASGTTSASAGGINNDGGQVVLPDAIPWGDVVWWGEEGAEEMRGSERRTRLAAIGRCAYQINHFYRKKVTDT